MVASAPCRVVPLLGMGLLFALLFCGRPAQAEGLAVVLVPKTSGSLTKEETARLEGAVTEALRSAQLQDVPPADREAILDGEQELRGCTSDECRDRIGRLLGAQSVLTQTWEVGRGEPAPAATPAAPQKAPAAKGRGAKKALPPPVAEQAPPPPGTWRFSVSVFNVQIGAVGAEETASCDNCGLDQATQSLSELVKKVVLLDAARPRGTIEVTSNPSADVLVDGRKLGFTPYRRAAFVGKHDITVARTGFRTIHTSLDVVEAKKASLEVKMVVGKDREYREERAARPKWRIGTGVAAIAVGAVLIGLGGSLLSIDGQCVRNKDTNTPPVNGASPTDCAPPLARPDGTSQYQTFTTLSPGVGLIVPGVLLVAAGTVLVVYPGPKRLVEVSTGMIGTGFGFRLASSF